MAANHSFYPRGRRDQLVFNNRVLEVLTRPSATGAANKQRWEDLGIPEPVFTAYGEAVGNATSALSAVELSGLSGFA